MTGSSESSAWGNKAYRLTFVIDTFRGKIPMLAVKRDQRSRERPK